MNEELMIKLKVDTSSVQSTINKLKNEASNVNKALSGTGSSNSSSKSSTDATKKSTEKLTAALNKVEQSVSKIKQGISGWDLAKAVIGAEALDRTLDGIKNKNSKLGTTLGNGLADNIRDAIGKIQFSGEGFTMVDPANMAQLDKLTDLEGTLRSLAEEGDLKGIKSLKKEVAGLGVSTKTAGTATLGFKAALSSVAAAAGVVATALGAVVLALAAVTTVAGVFASFAVSKLGSEIYHTAQQFGFSSKAFQEWSYIMERNGSSIEDLKGFLETLASEQAAVIEGSEDAIATFKRLGLSAEEVAGMDQQALFEQTVAKIQAIENATERSAIAYSLFGDEASRLMNVLNMNNAEMQEMINNYNLLGGGMSDALIEKSNGLQSSISNLKQAWQGISNTLAEAFIPVVRAIVDWLTKALVVINLFLRVIFGLDLNMKGASSSTSKGVSANKAYANSANAATKAVEKLKRTTMGFDELNIVQDPNASAGSSGGGAGASTPDLGGGLGSMEDLMPDMSALNLDAIYAWFEEYKGVIAQITTWSLILIGVILAVIGCMTVNIPMAIVGFGLAGLGISIGMTSGAFAKAWEAVKKVAIAAGNWIAGIPGWFWEDICVPIGDFFVNLWNAIVEGVKTAWNAVVGFVKAIPGWINDNIIKPIGNFFTNLWNGIKTGVSNAWNGTISFIKGIPGWISENIVKPVGNFFSGMWSGFKSGASQAWEGIKSVFGAITGWFKEKFSAAWTAVKNVFSTGGKIFDGIKEGIADTFKTVVNGLIGGINKIIAVPFNAINNLLNKIRAVSVAGVEPFKNLIKYNALSVPQIPKLATGGIVTRETLATIGEGGKREAVLPLEQNTGWMDALADKIAERNGAPSKIVLAVDGKELGWAAINNINNITKQTGGLQLALI